MKNLIRKFIHTNSAAVLACIAVYSLVSAQQVCCSNIGTICISTSNRTSGIDFINRVCSPSPSHHFRSGPLAKSRISDLGTGEICCETDYSETVGQATYTIPSFKSGGHLIKKIVCYIDSCSNPPVSLGAYDLPAVLRSAPIYILTQSILC